MKWIIYVCESCNCGFAIESFSDNGEACCPKCSDDMEITATGECMRDPHIEFDRD
jgi:uncharacterized paraquat-inducible protein A